MSNGKNSADAAAQLRDYVDRLVRLEDEKQSIADDIKDIKKEAASSGFDRKVLSQMVKEARMSATDRAAQREHEAICEVYRASLGMLNGTPLGDAARKRLSPPEPEQSDDVETETQQEPEATLSAEDIAEAKQRGRDEAKNGAKITENPFVSGDPRRAAWDEGWCAETGSDGMDIPEAFRRKPKPKKDDNPEDGK